DADPARGEGDQDAVRRRRRQRAHARGSGPELRGDARTHPADRGEGAAQAAPPVAVAQAARVPRRKNVTFEARPKRRAFSVRVRSGPIAQRSEPPAHNRPVPGSNPGGPNKNSQLPTSNSQATSNLGVVELGVGS